MIKKDVGSNPAHRVIYVVAQCCKVEANEV